MCNAACLQFGAAHLDRVEVEGKEVIEVGALDVNGSLRPAVAALGPRSYLGVDIGHGPGVDLICDAHRLLEELGPERFDLLISTEMIEHVRDWRAVIHNFKHLLRPGGVLLITTRSRGFHYHGYPHDYWRYEVEDMRRIFADFEIVALERDPLSPGVFLKARRPASFRERDFAGEGLYSVVTGRRVESVSNAELRWFRVRFRAVGIGRAVLRRLFLRGYGRGKGSASRSAASTSSRRPSG